MVESHRPVRLVPEPEPTFRTRSDAVAFFIQQLAMDVGPWGRAILSDTYDADACGCERCRG